MLDIEHHRRGWRQRLGGVARAQPRDLVAELAFDGCPGLAACWREVLRAPERWLATVGTISLSGGTPASPALPAGIGSRR